MYQDKTEDLHFQIFSRGSSECENNGSRLKQSAVPLATGQIDDAHTVPAAAAKAQLSVELLSALRNKALEAYTEIIRISI